MGPSLSVAEINRRHDLVQAFFDNTHFAAEIGENLSECKDVEKAFQRLHYETGGPIDFVGVIDTLVKMAQMRKLLSTQKKGPGQKALRELLTRLSEFADIIAECDGIFDNNALESNKLEGYSLKTGVSREVDQLRVELSDLEDMEKALPVELSKLTDLRELKLPH